MSEQDTSASNSAPDRSEPTVADVMRTGVPTIGKEDSVARVARIMVDSGVPGLVVLDNGVIAGIITESDLITRQSDFTPPGVTSVLDAVFTTDAGWDYDDEVRRALAMTAADLMTHPVYSIRSRATLGEIATLMHQYGVNPVPVVDDSDRLVGIVSRADIVRVIAILENDGSIS
jgi:CBS domain-containing protein